MPEIQTEEEAMSNISEGNIHNHFTTGNILEYWFGQLWKGIKTKFPNCGTSPNLCRKSKKRFEKSNKVFFGLSLANSYGFTEAV